GAGGSGAATATRMAGGSGQGSGPPQLSARHGPGRRATPLVPAAQARNSSIVTAGSELTADCRWGGGDTRVRRLAAVIILASGVSGGAPTLSAQSNAQGHSLGT